MARWRHSRSQIGELNFPYDTGMAVDLALDLVLKHAAGFGQLANDNKKLAAVGGVAHRGREADFLTDRKFMPRHYSSLMAFRGPALR